jgi:hypothetical protein
MKVARGLLSGSDDGGGTAHGVGKNINFYEHNCYEYFSFL